jgi:hypothetical protein
MNIENNEEIHLSKDQSIEAQFKNTPLLEQLPAPIAPAPIAPAPIAPAPIAPIAPIINTTLMIIDNFYNNPMETRNYILTQEFKVKGNYPGQRTKSFATEELKNIFQKYIEPHGGKITRFDLKEDDNYNGAFQYTTSKDRSWVHTDGWNNWAAVIFMTPYAPLSSGTGLYMYEDGTRYDHEHEYRNNKTLVDRDSQDMTKWNLVDRIGNVFNRLVLFNAQHYHTSVDYFGSCKEDGRLFQTFFFSTER